MGLINNIDHFDPERDKLLRDYTPVPKGEVGGRKVIPDKTARALKAYVTSATAEQKAALERAAASAPKGGRLKAIAQVITASPGKVDSSARALFQAIISQPTPSSTLSSAPAPTPSPPVKATSVEAINAAFGLKIPSGAPLHDVREAAEMMMNLVLTRPEPLSEGDLKKIAGAIRLEPKVFQNFPKALLNHIVRTSEALERGTFRRSSDNNPSSGVYFGSASGRTTVVVKPALEEYKTPYNPNPGFMMPSGERVSAKGETGTALRAGMFSGDAASKERAAYLTDMLDGAFAKTPPTLLVKIRRREPMQKEGTSPYKVCSVQAFITGRAVGRDDMPHLSQEELERIAYADIDEGNADRHFCGNLFIEGGKLTRIDQGLTRGTDPDTCRFDWKQCPQLLRSMLPQTIAKIRAQDIDLRIQTLRSLGIPERAIELERARILLKKEAAEQGLSFYDLSATLVYRKAGGKSAFAQMIERVDKGAPLSEEIKTMVSNIAGWKRHIADVHRRDRPAAWKEVKSGDVAKTYPHLQACMDGQLLLLEGRA